jgi:hypothetical protein
MPKSVHTSRVDVDQAQCVSRISGSPGSLRIVFSCPSGLETMRPVPRVPVATTIATRWPSGETLTSRIISRAPNCFA